MSTFYGLEIAKTGLYAAQNGLQLTGHNIANADTEGYTRQRLHTSAVPPSYGDNFIAQNTRAKAGRGVTIVNVEQVRNAFLDYQYRKENTTTTKWSVKEQYFGYIESLFNNELDSMESTTGISQMFSNFYDALYELAENPEKSETRVNMQQQAITLVETMNYYSSRLQEQQQTLNECVRVTVNEVNSLANQIATLNKQIFSYELTGAIANDLRDQRNMLLDTLSGLADINAYEDVNGYMVVELDGKNLIRHGDVAALAVREDRENTLYSGEPTLKPVWADKEGKPTIADVKVSNGALKGYMEVRDGDSESEVGINYVIHELDKLCQKIALDINTIHEQGYTFPTDSNPESRTGIKFFDVPVLKDQFGNNILDENGNKQYDYSQITAQSFKLTDDIMDNVYNIAASDMPISAKDETGSEVANDQKGNGNIAMALCQVVWQKDENGNPNNIDGVYKSLLNAISLEMNYIETTKDSQDVMLGHLSDQRASITDVSLDEEMANVVVYGHAYNAAARVLSAIDEQLEKLINGTGRVGL